MIKLIAGIILVTNILTDNLRIFQRTMQYAAGSPIRFPMTTVPIAIIRELVT